MTKEEAYNQVTEKVNPLIEDLKMLRSGDYPMEEFEVAYWEVEELREICDNIFEETYNLVNDK